VRLVDHLHPAAAVALDPQELSTITLFDGVAVADFNGLPGSASRWL
jgi:hypothetical protein